MERLVHSSKFWCAALDALFSSVLLLAARFWSPSDVELVKQLIVIYQPVFAIVIAGVAYEDAAATKATASLVPQRVGQAVTPPPSAVFKATEKRSD